MARPKVHSRTAIADDLELHVMTTTIGTVTLVDVRQYIPSIKKYGRGVVLPQERVPDVVAGLHAAVRGIDA